MSLSSMCHPDGVVGAVSALQPMLNPMTLLELLCRDSVLSLFYQARISLLVTTLNLHGAGALRDSGRVGEGSIFLCIILF